MTNVSKFLIGAAFAALVLPSSAMAAVVGAGDGQFSNLTNCDHSGSSQDCQIVNTGNGTATQVQWGSTSSNNNFVNPSTLTAVDTAIGSFSTSQTNVKIAQLTWYNSATRGDSTPDDFNVDYQLTVTFSQPGGSSGDIQLFPLRIVSPTNATGDSVGAFTLAELAGLSFTLPGWSVTNFHYVAANGTTFGTCAEVSGNNNWCNPENNTGNLFIEADFTQIPTSVPEPMTLSLFGAGLAGAAAMRLRRRNKKA